MQKISTCLWFDHRAAEAADFYVSIFPNSRLLETVCFPQELAEPPASASPGSVVAVRFELNGVEHMALNGRSDSAFSPAISLVAWCENQDEVDRLWAALLDGGREDQCGWLSDKFGVCWQVVPRQLPSLFNAPDKAAAARAFAAMMTMRKIDMAAVQAAFDAA